MNEEEIEIMDLLANAWGKFLRLPIQHSNDQREFCDRMHDLQRMIMSREAVRNNPEYFVNEHADKLASAEVKEFLEGKTVKEIFEEFGPQHTKYNESLKL